MTRTRKFLILGAVGAWLLGSTACEDKVCLEQLKTCKKESGEQRKESAANLDKLQELKTQLAESQTKIESLTKENDELKQAAEAAAKSKASGTKGKRKKRARR